MNKKESMLSKKSKFSRLILCVVLSLFVLVFCSGAVFANGNGNNSVSVMINGQELQGDTSAFIDENSGRTLIPFKVFMEQIGISNINYNVNTKEINAENNDGSIKIKLIIGRNIATVNEKVVILDQPSIIWLNRTYVPLRFIASSFGFNVNYNNGVVNVNGGNNIINNDTNNDVVSGNSNIPKVYLGNPENDNTDENINTTIDTKNNNKNDEDEYIVKDGMKVKKDFLIPINPNE